MNALARALPLLLLVLAAACERGPQATVPKVADARAERDVNAGVAQLTTTLVVRFDRPVKLAESHEPLASNFELQVPDPVNGTAATKRVLVQKAELEQNTRSVTLHIDALVPEGSTLKIANRAFRAEATGETVLDVASDMSLPGTVLASTALAIDNPSVLTAPVNPEPTAADRDPQVQRTALQALLKKHAADDATTQKALALYDSIPESQIPSPKVRAALAALTGTFAEPAIDALLTGANCTKMPVARVVIQVPPNQPELLARVTFTQDGRRVISLNPLLEGDRIEHLMPFLAHESIHCDNSDTKAEEVVATSFDTFLYLQLIAADATVVDTPPSVAARELNLDAIALINSGRRLPESVGILPSVGVKQVLPGTNAPFGSFAELVAAAYPEVPPDTAVPEAVADAYAANLAAIAGMPQKNAFDVAYTDELLSRAMDPLILATDISALGLTPTR